MRRGRSSKRRCPQPKEAALLSRSDDPQRHAFPPHWRAVAGTSLSATARGRPSTVDSPAGSATACGRGCPPRCASASMPPATSTRCRSVATIRRDVEEVISAPWHLNGSNVRAHKRAAGPGENSPPPLRARRARRLDPGRSPGGFGTKLRAWRLRAAGCRTARARSGAPAHRGDDPRGQGPVRARAPR